MEEHGSTVVENFSLFVDTMKTTGLQAIRYSKHSNETSEGDQSSPPPLKSCLPHSLQRQQILQGRSPPDSEGHSLFYMLAKLSGS